MGNLALNKTVTASSYVAPYAPIRVVNGDITPTSRWLCKTLPGWISVDLGTNGSYNYWINRWVVRHMTNAGWQSPNYNISDFKIQGSNDNTNWVDIDSVTSNTINVTDRTFTAVPYRYVRLYVTKGLRCNSQLASIMELEVYQSPPLSAYLQNGTGLVVSSGALSPSFTNTVLNYTTPNVSNSVTSVNVIPTAEDSRATIKVNGTVVISGKGIDVPLNVGSNSISVQVTAADGLTTNGYTVSVVRNSGSSNNAKLANIVSSSGTLNPQFNSDVTSGYVISRVTTQTITVTPTAQSNGASITVNNISVVSGQPSQPITIPRTGSAAIIIDVVAEDGISKVTYNLNARK